MWIWSAYDILAIPEFPSVNNGNLASSENPQPCRSLYHVRRCIWCHTNQIPERRKFRGDPLLGQAFGNRQDLIQNIHGTLECARAQTCSNTVFQNFQSPCRVIRSWHNATWQVFHPIHCPRLPVAGLVTLKVFGGTMMRPRAAMVPRKHEHRRPPLMSMILYDFHISKWRFCRLDQACWLHWDVQSPNFLGICRMPRPRVQRPRHHRWAAGPFCSKAHSP